MTQHFADVEHVGGPYDGQTQRVPLDAEGQPPTLYVLREIGRIDHSIPPFLAGQAGAHYGFYELDVRVGDNGPVHVYRYTGCDERTAEELNGGPVTLPWQDPGRQAA